MVIRGLAVSFLILCGCAFGKDSIPRFVVEPQSAIVRTGSSLVLYCAVEPDSTSVRWMLNGSYLTSQKRRGFEMRDGSNLRIPSFNQPDSLSHEGTYQCIATNSMGSIISKEAKVEAAVLGSYPAMRAVTEITAIEGNIAVVPCTLPESKPRAIIEILFNGSKLSPSTRHVVLPSGNLHIATVNQRDQGLYQCSALNTIIGNSVLSSGAFRLRVLVPVSEVSPVFTSTMSESVTANQGNNLTLECAAEGWPVPHITWEKYGGHLPTGRFSQVLGNLVISRIQKFEAGTYLCRVNKSSGPPLDKVINVDVLEPPSIETAPSEQTATEGGTAQFKCRPQGSPKQGFPKPSIQWLFNSETIINEQFIAVRDTSLHLSNVNRRRSGMYQCIVRNSLGMVHASARLNVIDPSAAAKTPPNVQPTPGGRPLFPNEEYGEYEDEDLEDEEGDDYDAYNSYEPGRMQPGPNSRQRNQDDKSGNRNPADGKTGKVDSEERPVPSKPKVTILTNTSVLLEWNMPVMAAHEPTVSMFKIQVKEIIDEPNSRWQTLDDDVSYGLRMFEVRGLKSGKTYKFRVVVKYIDQGTKPGLVSSKVTLLASQRLPLPIPKILEVRPVSKCQIFIRWQQQKPEERPVDGYHIYYVPYESNAKPEKQTLSSTIHSTFLQHLIPGTEYTIRMQSFGKLGEKSSFSTPVVKATPKNNEEIPADSIPGGHLPGGRYPSTCRNDDDSITQLPEGQEQPSGASDENSNRQLTFIIIGILLGVVIVLIVSCAFVCLWKRHKKQSYDDGERKHPDQKTAFLSSSRPSKPDAINGLVNISDYKVDRDHLPSCSGECSLPGNGFCSAKDSRNACSMRHCGQSRKLVPDLVLPPPPAMPPPCHQYRQTDNDLSVYDTVDDDPEKHSSAYAKISNMGSDSSIMYPNFPSQGAFGNPPRPSSDNIPKPLDSQAYWVLEQSRVQNLPDRPTNHMENFAPVSQCPSYRQNPVQPPLPGNKLTKTVFDRDSGMMHSTDGESDHYEKPNSPRTTLTKDNVRLNPLESYSWSSSAKAPNVDQLFSHEPVPEGRRMGQKPSESFPNPRDPVHDSWKNLTSQVSDGQYNIQHSGSGKNGPLPNNFALPRANDYPSSDQEDCR